MNLKKHLVALTALGMLSSTAVMAAPFGGVGPGGTGDDGAGTSLTDVFNNIATDGTSDVIASTDYLDDDADSTWELGGTNTGSAVLVIEIAGNHASNNLGIYKGNDQITVFEGAATDVERAVLSINVSGHVIVTRFDGDGLFVSQTVHGDDVGELTQDWSDNRFGFYLETASNGTFYSDSDLNADGFDHMAAYQGVGEEVDLDDALGGDDSATDGGTLPGPWATNEYILAWEDVSCAANGCDGDYNDMVVMIESISPVPAPATLALLGLGLAGLAYSARRKA